MTIDAKKFKNIIELVSEMKNGEEFEINIIKNSLYCKSQHLSPQTPK
jgi:hypothetical protein